MEIDEFRYQNLENPSIKNLDKLGRNKTTLVNIFVSIGLCRDELIILT